MTLNQNNLCLVKNPSPDSIRITINIKEYQLELL